MSYVGDGFRSPYAQSYSSRRSRPPSPVVASETTARALETVDRLDGHFDKWKGRLGPIRTQIKETESTLGETKKTLERKQAELKKAETESQELEKALKAGLRNTEDFLRRYVFTKKDGYDYRYRPPILLIKPDDKAYEKYARLKAGGPRDKRRAEDMLKSKGIDNLLNNNFAHYHFRDPALSQKQRELGDKDTTIRRHSRDIPGHIHDIAQMEAHIEALRADPFMKTVLATEKKLAGIKDSLTELQDSFELLNTLHRWK